MMNGVDEEGGQFLKVEEWDNNEMVANEEQVDEYGLSLNVLAKSYAHNTIRIKRNWKKKPYNSYWQWYSFIDEHVVKGIRTTIKKTNLLTINVTNESVMKCSVFYPKLWWKIQGHEFQANLKVLKLEMYDMVSEMDWLKLYLPILFDFIKIKLSFKREEKMIKLKEIIKRLANR